MRTSLPFYLIALLSTVAFLLLQWRDPGLIRDHLESKTYDLRMQFRKAVQHQAPRSEIIIVDIDERSLAEIGRWPWSREVMARLVRTISAGQPKVIGIDILFSEREHPAADAALAEALAEAGNVVLATAFLGTSGTGGKTGGEAPDFLWDSAFMQVHMVPGIAGKKWAVKAGEVLPPIEEVARHALLGHVITHPDLDGVLRWEILAVSFGEDFYPSLGLQVARIAAGIPLEEMTLHAGSGVQLGDRFIPTDLSGRVLVNYYGQENSFPRISAADLLAGRASPGDLRNRIVLVGTSAFGTYDQKVTPLSANMPGVEKNASVVQNILFEGFIRKSPGVLELATILLTAILLVFFLPRQSARGGVILGFGLMTFYLVLSCFLLLEQQIWVNLFYPLSNMMLIVGTETIGKLFSEEKKAREIRSIFSSYVSPKIVEALIRNPEMLALGGERRTVTILFADMIGFTTLSEKLPPEAVVNMLNEYYKEMAEVIFHWDGTLDKFVGDEIMALWGAPTDQPDHAERAVRCALHMSDRLDHLHDMWRGKGQEVVDCGIGLNTGEVLIGNVGLAGKKMDYTAIGNHVNIAARVEKMTRQYGSRILITENTLNEINLEHFGHTAFVDLDRVKVKGKMEEVRIIAVKPLREDEDGKPNPTPAPGERCTGAVQA